MALAFAISPVRAVCSDALTLATELFDAGHKNTPPAVALARRVAVEWKRQHPDDLRIDYAFGIVLANQRRYSDGRRLIGRYLSTRPDDLVAQRIKLWCEIEDGQCTSALESIALIGKMLALPDGDNPSPDQIVTARYIGVCFAFIKNIQPNGLDEHAFAEQKRALLGNFNEEYILAFDDGVNLVTSELEELKASRVARLKRAEEAADEKSKSITTDLNTSVEKIEAQRNTIQSSTEQVRDAQRELGVIRQQLASLGQDRVRLSAQIITLQTQINILQQGAVVDRRIPGDQRPVVPRTEVDLAKIVQAQTLSLSLAALNKQAFDMDRLILSLQTRGAELSGTSQAEFKKLSESRAAAEKAAKKAEKLSKQLERQEAESLKQPPRLTGRMTRFSTYAPLPYEEESQRVLGWFAN